MTIQTTKVPSSKAQLRSRAKPTIENTLFTTLTKLVRKEPQRLPRTAILLNGPSGVGKSTLAESLCSEYDFKHVNADAFKSVFSSKRSKTRTDIGEKLAYLYGKELIVEGFSVIVEALPEKYLAKLKQLMKRKGYALMEISLVAPVLQCIQNDRMKRSNRYGKKVVREVYPKLLVRRGHVIDVTGKSKHEVFQAAIRYVRPRVLHSSRIHSC